MPGILFYFQMHQPYRIRRYSVFDTDGRYFDDASNAEICRKVADKCYRPAISMLLDMARQHTGPSAFKCALSITCTLLDQLEQHAPDVLHLLRELVQTGQCELLGETSHHSLASLYNPDEFAAQVELHSQRVRSLFGSEPSVFRNTELIYSTPIARLVASLKRPDGSPRFRGMFAEGTPTLLSQSASPARALNQIYAPSGVSNFGLLVRNSRLSDDIAFRFSLRSWPHWPLTADTYASWLIDASQHGPTSICMDLETFGEHQWAETGIFQFFRQLPASIAAKSSTTRFILPSEALAQHQPQAIIDIPEPCSWADESRDISAWRGNAMQVHALEELYRLGRTITATLLATADDPVQHEAARDMLRTWRLLTTSDHAYYMSTKGAADGQVHAYFRPFDSPYEAYISFVNVLRHMSSRFSR
jgi:alpha-amylase